jgi:hypothetical protein
VDDLPKVDMLISKFNIPRDGMDDGSFWWPLLGGRNNPIIGFFILDLCHLGLMLALASGPFPPRFLMCTAMEVIL